MRDTQDKNSRKIAMAVLGLVGLTFIAISAASFDASRDRIDPVNVRFQGYTAVDGKRVFQSYNCMGCHTILGNGAYFAPDITGVYATNGPAWLMAWLSDPTVWPTKPTVEQWIARLGGAGVVEAASVDAYYATFDGAAADGEDRGGWGTIMPRLAFNDVEKPALVAFMSYASKINTQGWPPVPNANAAIVERMRGQLRQAFPGLRPTPAP